MLLDWHLGTSSRSRASRTRSFPLTGRCASPPLTMHWQLSDRRARALVRNDKIALIVQT